jgi:hypothetical protein
VRARLLVALLVVLLPLALAGAVQAEPACIDETVPCLPSCPPEWGDVCGYYEVYLPLLEVAGD